MGSLRTSIHFWVRYGALCLLVISLPSSRYFLSISLFLLLINWIVEGDYKTRFQGFLSNRPAVALTLIYAGYLISLFWTKDLNYALQNDLLHKSPTLFMPLVFSSSPKLEIKKLRLLLFLFCASVLTISLIGLSIRLSNPNTSYREASPFMPGIYFGMMLILAAVHLPVLVKQVSDKSYHLVAALAVSAWMIVFLFYMRNLSGIASFAVVAIYLLILGAGRLKSIYLKLLAGAAFLALALIFLWPFKDIYRLSQAEVETDFSQLAQFSENGTPYLHDTTNILRENGYLVYLNIAERELGEAWNKRSELDFNGKDLKTQDLKHTLYRYMSSLGLTKDLKGLDKMSDRDICAVEKGITNYMNLDRSGYHIRAYEELKGLFIYRKSGYANSEWGSLSQRLDLWRASIHAFIEKPLFGWGTGSIRQAVDYGFNKHNSPLTGQNMKPHNQYLYFLLTQGIVGLLFFMGLYGFAMIRSGAWRCLLFRIFLLVYLVNFLANNSLESQLGQNLFIFFTVYYFFLYTGKRAL